MSNNGTATAAKANGRPASKKAKPKRSRGTESECLAASFFALKSGSIENAKKAVEELKAQHGEALKFVTTCGDIDAALEQLDQLTERLEEE